MSYMRTLGFLIFSIQLTHTTVLAELNTPTKEVSPETRQVLNATLKENLDLPQFYKALRSWVSNSKNINQQQRKNIITSVSKTLKKEKLIRHFALIYEKHYTKKDMKELSTFFKTPVGKKFLQKQALIDKEVKKEGRIIGQKIMKQLAEHVISKGSIPSRSTTSK